jgi:hypothetical protein
MRFRASVRRRNLEKVADQLRVVKAEAVEEVY